jgi:hypothetical protein
MYSLRDELLNWQTTALSRALLTHLSLSGLKHSADELQHEWQLGKPECRESGALAFASVITGQRNNRLMRVRWPPGVAGTCRSRTWATSDQPQTLRKLAHVYGLTERCYPGLSHKRLMDYCFWKVALVYRAAESIEKALDRTPRIPLRVQYKTHFDCARNVDTLLRMANSATLL